MEQIKNLSQTAPELEEVPGLMPYKRVIPTKTKNKALTRMHGTLKATDMRMLVEEKEKAEEEKGQRKKEKEVKKELLKEVFQARKLKCVCKEKVCKALYVKECMICGDILKSQCNKKGCKSEDGKLPEMGVVAAR